MKSIHAGLLGLAACLALAVPARSAPEGTGWTDAECMDCHPGEARRWKASRHASSADNANFRTAWPEARHRDWCLECHRPDGADAVTCTSCHRDHEPTGTEVCATCHEFEGPRVHGALALGGDLLQSTVSEWRASGAAEGCADCHLAGHRFPGAHDTALLREALAIRAEPDALIVETTAALGHRVPTGDPFRRLEIALCEDPACTRVAAQRTLGVVHAADADGFLRVVRDDRLGPPGGEAPAVLRVPRPAGATAWRVRLALADPTLILPESERFQPIASGGFP